MPLGVGTGGGEIQTLIPVPLVVQSSDEESFEAEEEELANQALELAATEGGFQVALDAPAANGPNPFAVDVSTLPPLLPDLEECVLPPPPPPMHATPQSGAVSLPSPSAAAAAKKEEDERLAKLQNEVCFAVVVGLWRR